MLSVSCCNARILVAHYFILCWFIQLFHHFGSVFHFIGECLGLEPDSHESLSTHLFPLTANLSTSPSPSLPLLSPSLLSSLRVYWNGPQCPIKILAHTLFPMTSPASWINQCCHMRLLLQCRSQDHVQMLPPKIFSAPFLTFTILKGCPVMHCSRSVCVFASYTFQSHKDAFPSLPLIPDNFGSTDRCCPVHRWLRVRAARPQADPGTPQSPLRPHIPVIRSAGLQQRSVPDWNSLIGADGLLFKGMPVNDQIWRCAKPI